MRRTRRIRAAAAFMLSVGAASALAAADGWLETSECGAFKEWLSFKLWARAAGSPDRRAASALPNVEAISHTTIDGRTLRGYRIRSRGISRGALLVAQGNATLADQLLDTLGMIARDEMDVFVFDYRGYGLSEGVPRLRAILSDYRALAAEVVSIAPGRLYLYGISFGGVVLMNVQAELARVDGLVIDSSPSLVSDLGCPPRYDPISKVPAAANHVLMIVGERDRVVPPGRSAALAEAISSRGGRVERRDEFDHPYMDRDPKVHHERLRLIADFLSSR